MPADGNGSKTPSWPNAEFLKLQGYQPLINIKRSPKNRLEKEIALSTDSPDTAKAKRILLKACVLVILLLGLYLVYQLAGMTQNVEGAGLAGKVSALRSFIDSLGLLGPAVFVAVSTAAIMVYIPAVVIVCVAVCIFGGINGAVLATASIYMAVTAVYFTAQFLGRDMVVRAAGSRFNDFETRLAGKGLVTVIYMRLFFFVFPPTNWLLGLSALSFRDVFLGTVLGTVHHIIIFAWMTDAVMEVIRRGGSLNPLETRTLLIPMLAGTFVFAAVHIISYRIQRSRPNQR